MGGRVFVHKHFYFTPLVRRQCVGYSLCELNSRWVFGASVAQVLALKVFLWISPPDEHVRHSVSRAIMHNVMINKSIT